MKNSKNRLYKKYFVLAFLIVPAFSFAQETNDSIVPAPAPKKEYVRATFENGVVINNQTVRTLKKNSMEFMIQHRFGLIENEKDLFGLFASSNIRLGLNYGITDRIEVGVGATRMKSLYDFRAKVSILKQTKEKGMPISLTYFGDLGRSAQDQSLYLNQDGEYKAVNKISYFNEIMIARKFNSKISAQVAFTYSYFNIIDSLYQQHDFYGVSFVGRYKFSPQSSVMLDFDYLLNVSGMNADVKPLPNMSIGYEVSTGSHQFQIFAGTGYNIIDQEYRVYNQNDFTKLEVLLGFNITRIWGFK